ncbi:MAG: phosphoribosylformylglycinamidine synthase subunit PurL [Candidatus Jordarchaeum sp.]|uniref:phosphoribosylformylglycinamidine synthase subunit PurL n=1 Tax=Candidatus Jordarchaeum sp. TaxID=2823881 RepID=UPI00404AD8BA
MVDGIQVDLKPEELEKAEKMMGRKPNAVEAGMIDVMWSEHCSYKSSRPVLKLLPQKGPRVVCGPGNDAGVVDIGDGYVAVFKIESHNHPSAIEPYNGAATGIGGIIRDILCMGARPIALLDPLRFGSIKSAHSRWLFKYVVKGIADYGNCVGIPTVGGEVEFDESFEQNCLVNVACVGIAKKEEIVLAQAKYPGDVVILAGGATGRDGIHGVTFASRNLTEESEEDRPAVQVGDPFTKKLIIDSTLEILQTGFVHGLKDLGGGGLTCGSSEMANKGDTGIDIEISKIHLREKGLTPFEIMLSESQERMLFIVDPKGVEKVTGILQKYGLSWSIVGKVTKSKNINVFLNGKIVAKVPAKLLAESPIIERIAEKPTYIEKLKTVEKPPMPAEFSKILIKLMASENIASKEWVYRQYDHEVGIRSIVKCGEGDAAVLRIIGKDKGIAVSSDCNSKYCYLDPYNGGAGATAEACRNVTAVGARPLAIVDCLNFGNPEKPDIFWQFKETVRGMSDMCKVLGTPCVGGNVSFYNEDEVTKRAVKPSPVVVALGVLDTLKNITTLTFKNINDYIVLLGETFPEMGGSEYYYSVHRFEGGIAPKVDMWREKNTMELVWSAIKNNYVNAAHDCSVGGLGVALSLMSIKSNRGIDIDLSMANTKNLRLDELLFSESHSRFIVTTPKSNIDVLLEFAKSRNVPAFHIGNVSGLPQIVFHYQDNEVVNCNLIDVKQAWECTIPSHMGQ